MDRNNYKNLLVIRFSALGDVAMTVPVLKAFTRQYPECKITFLTRPFFRPILQDIDNVEIYEAELKGNHKGITGLARLYAALAKQKFDAVLDLHNVLRTNVLKRYFIFSNIPYRQIDKGRQEKKALTRSKNKEFKPLKSTFERYADVFRSLGFELDLRLTDRRERLPLPEKTILEMGRSTHKWIGIAPFAAFPGKVYPIEMMREVIHILNNTDKYKILLFGAGAHEKEILSSMAADLRNTISLVGKYPLKDELALISNLDVMLSMDSGNGHLAAIFAVPTVTLWGVTHPYAGFSPFGHDPENSLLSSREEYPLIPTSVYGNKLPAGYEMAMSTIAPHQVAQKLEEVLEG